MLKQIKKRLAEMVIIGCMVPCLGLPEAVPASSSDVVENKSVIDEQIYPAEDTKQLDCIIQGGIAVVLLSNEEKNTKKFEIYTDGWVDNEVNVYLLPASNSTVLTTYNFNTQIKYTYCNDEWVKIKYGDTVGYIEKDFIRMEECPFTDTSVISHKDFKSYMGYKAITNKSSKQYLIQNDYAYTGNFGIRQVNGRYCVAIGSYFNAEIGQYFDLILENGNVIPCIMGDAKADCDTDTTNVFSINGCCSEFIVDTEELISSAKTRGSISYACEEWESQVVTIRVYEKNILNN